MEKKVPLFLWCVFSFTAEHMKTAISPFVYKHHGELLHWWRYISLFRFRNSHCSEDTQRLLAWCSSPERDNISHRLTVCKRRFLIQIWGQKLAKSGRRGGGWGRYLHDSCISSWLNVFTKLLLIWTPRGGRLLLCSLWWCRSELRCKMGTGLCCLIVQIRGYSYIMEIITSPTLLLK